MSLLDRLLPKGWQSQVRSTFSPNRLSLSDFTPGADDEDQWKKYKNLLDEGYALTSKGWDEFTKGSGAAWDEALDKESKWFSDHWIDPSDIDPINLFDPDSLMAGFERARMSGVGKDMFTPFKASDLRALDPSSYTAQMEKDRSYLAGQLQDRLATSAGLGGGFAGYGGREKAQDFATQQFQSGAEGLYADINKQRAGAVGNLYSKLEDYDKLISQAT